MIPYASCTLRQSTDALAVVTIEIDARAFDVLGAPLVDGELYGPHCTRTRTLRTTYAVSQRDVPAIGKWRWEIVVPDPCYWTPELPFLYDLTLRAADAAAADACLTIGLRRLQTHRRSLRLENRRYVLRGALVPQIDAATRKAARNANAALWIAAPSPQDLAAAAREGVWLVADLRAVPEGAAPGDATALLDKLSWQPAVALAVLTREQLAAVALTSGDVSKTISSRGVLLAQVADASDAAPEKSPAAQLLVVELRSQQPPPAWLADFEAPVIAIRRQTSYADLAEARRGCELLQAELAPSCDLAGYFTSLDR